MKKIMYILLDESKNSSTTIKTPEFNITVIQGNKAYLCQPMIGQRWHAIYLDKQFEDKQNNHFRFQLLHYRIFDIKFLQTH